MNKDIVALSTKIDELKSIVKSMETAIPSNVAKGWRSVEEEKPIENTFLIVLVDGTDGKNDFDLTPCVAIYTNNHFEYLFLTEYKDSNVIPVCFDYILFPYEEIVGIERSENEMVLEQELSYRKEMRSKELHRKQEEEREL